MKRIITVFFAVIAACSSYSQTYIQAGDSCFVIGDYACAITKYDNAFKNASGKDKQIAEIKLTRAKWCSEHIKTANLAFNNKNFTSANAEYESVLESNPKDSFAQSQLVKCIEVLNKPSTPTLRKATTSDLTDIWNNKYGVIPDRRQNLIDAGINPDDAQKRINNGEGKPATLVNQVTTLSVENQNVSFFASGGSTTINVNTNATTYQITFLPSWCSVGKKDSKGFSLVCDANTKGLARSDWFKVIAGNKDIKIYINQSGAANSTTAKALGRPTKNRKYFNCPKGRKHTVGLSLGYANKPIINFDYDYTLSEMSGGSFGLRIEPLFKYGFGLNMGIFYEYYPEQYNNGSSKMAVNIPFNLEYRLNFHENFSMFFYGGASVDYMINAVADFDFSGESENVYYLDYFDKNRFVPYLEYGGGIRIKKIQFNTGLHYFIDTQSDFFVDKQMSYSVSCSIMF